MESTVQNVILISIDRGLFVVVANRDTDWMRILPVKSVLKIVLHVVLARLKHGIPLVICREFRFD